MLRLWFEQKIVPNASRKPRTKLIDSLLIAVAYVSVQSRSELGIIHVIEAKLDAYDHTTLNAPVPVRSPKLSSVGPDQYLDG